MRFRAALLFIVVSVSLTAIGGRAFGLGLLIPKRSSRRVLPPDVAPDVLVREEMIEMPRQDVHPLAIKDQTVKVAIKDQVTRTRVDQTFHNSSGRVLEGSFLFPLPSGSSVSDFALYINGKRQPGEMLEAARAKAIYEGIVRRMQDPALLEYIGDNLFKARVFPIPPRGDRRIDLTFEQVLKLDNGLCTYTLPLKAPGSFDKPIGSFSLTLTLESQRPIKTIYSPSHKVRIERDGEHRATISFEAENLKPDRDFTLIYSVDEKSFGCSLLTHRPDPDEDGYFMLLLTPKQKIDADEILPKDVTFVVDTSGSMSGEKMDKARAALEMCVGALDRKKDRFNIIGFSTSVDPLWPGVRPANAANKRKARLFIKKRLRARGGTAIDAALKAALSHRPAQGRPYMVVFMTDGKPTVGPRDPATILADVKKSISKGTRLFCLGVGDRVNTKLLDLLSDKYRGTSQYIRPGEDIEIKVSSFFDKISCPVMADIELGFGNIEVTERYPKRLPDLFKGSQIEVVGRYRNHGEIAMTLSGLVGDKRIRLAYDADFPARDDSNEFLQRLWAQRKVAYLLDEIRLNGMNGELKDEIVRLGKKYCIETPYTSFLVVDDDELSPPRPRFGRRVKAFRRTMAAPAIAAAPEATRGFSGGGIEYKDGAGRSWKGKIGVARRARYAAPAGEAAGFDLSSDSGASAVDTATRLDSLKKSSIVGGSRDGNVRSVGSRTFSLRGKTWVDSDYREGMKKLTVRYGSGAWDTLVRVLKKLRPVFALGRKVLVVYRGKAIEISDDDGLTRLDEKTLRKFLES